MAFNPRKLGALCDQCPRKAQVPVPSEGPVERARYVWLGQDPGQQETRQGRPFVGPTGSRLMRLWTNACNAVGVPIERNEVLVTNSALCEPLTKSDKEAKEAMDCCRPRLMRELAERADPRAAILSMGKWSWYALTGERQGVGKYQGFHVMLKLPAKVMKSYVVDRRDSKGTAWTVPVLHPAFTFRQPQALGPLSAHVEGFVRRAVHGFAPEPLIEKDPPVDRLKWLMTQVKAKRVGLAVDIETKPPDKHHFRHIKGERRDALALLPGFAAMRSISVGADFGGGKLVGMAWFWPPPAEVRQELQRIFADPLQVKIFVNGFSFDLPVLRRHGLEVR